MPNARQLAALAAVVGCDVRTVRSYFDGGRVLPIYARAIEDAWNRARAGEPLTVALSRGDGAGPDVRRMA
jgi:hypothetical protein